MLRKLAIILNEGRKVCLLLLQQANQPHAALRQTGWSRHSKHSEHCSQGPMQALGVLQQRLQTSM